MTLENDKLNLIRQEIVKNHLQINALIQDIQQCTGPLELLNELNADGRQKIAVLRSLIERFQTQVKTIADEKKRSSFIGEIESLKGQLSTTLSAFRKANIVSVCVIDKMSKEELLSMPEEQADNLRKRRDKQQLANMSNQVTDKLLSISRHLAETNQRSADTLETLLTSSDKVTSTKDELDNQQQAIVQSGKLLGKYGRREVTDKALLALAFAFFLACVFYILQKRLF